MFSVPDLCKPILVHSYDGRSILCDVRYAATICINNYSNFPISRRRRGNIHSHSSCIRRCHCRWCTSTRPYLRSSGIRRQYSNDNLHLPQRNSPYHSNARNHPCRCSMNDPRFRHIWSIHRETFCRHRHKHCTFRHHRKQYKLYQHSDPHRNRRNLCNCIRRHNNGRQYCRCRRSRRRPHAQDPGAVCPVLGYPAGRRKYPHQSADRFRNQPSPRRTLPHHHRTP